MKLSDSIRRSLRTAFHAVLALVTLVPAAFALLPSGSPVEAKGAIVVAAVAAISALINKLEDAGLIPAWLKNDAPVVDDSAAPEGDAPAEDPAAGAAGADSSLTLPDNTAVIAKGGAAGVTAPEAPAAA